VQYTFKIFISYYICIPYFLNDFIGYGWWRSPVADLHGVQEVSGLNPVIPTLLPKRQSCKRLSFYFSATTLDSIAI